MSALNELKKYLYTNETTLMGLKDKKIDDVLKE